MSKRIVNDPSLHGWTNDNGKWVWDGTESGAGAGAGMIISETEPADPVTGMQWLHALTGEVFIYDDGKWLEFPSGKDGAAGADGNIADGAVDQDGVVATWDNAYQQWTPDSSLTIDASGDATFSGEVFSPNMNGANYLSTSVTALGVGVSGKSRLEFYANGAPDSAVFYNESGVRNFYITQSGNATFSEAVNFGGGRGALRYAEGVLGANGIVLENKAGNSGVIISNNGTQFTPTSTGIVNLGHPDRMWNDAHFSGTVNAQDHIATSDERLKDNITTAPVGLIDSLKGREWDWKESGEKASGVVAQELEQVLPHLVHDGHDGMKSVSYAGLVAYLIEEVKALKAEVEALKNG